MKEINEVYQAAVDRLREEITERAELLTRFECVLFGGAFGSHLSPIEIITRIHRLLDGEEWDSSTMSAVAELLTDNGYTIRDPNDPKPRKTRKSPEKGPRGSATRKPKGPGRGKGRKVLSQTKAAKLARAYREKQKAKATAEKAPAAGPTTGAHEALAEQSAADVEAAAKAQSLPPQDPNRRRARQPGTKEPGSLHVEPATRKPTTPPNGSGSLAELTQREAIKSILRKATRPLDCADILNALHAGGYKFKSQNPRNALTVALATYRGELTTETRAGRVFYHPMGGDQKTS